MPTTPPTPTPVPVGSKYAIIRFDMAHLEGQLEGVYIDEIMATKLLAAHRRVCLLPDTFAHATHANFILFKRVDDRDDQGVQSRGVDVSSDV